jgi:pimeloyl-ACP methyl ester carboxylesterase
MFVTRACWRDWVEYFSDRGYGAAAPAWPGREAPADELRRAHPDAALGQLTLDKVVDHYATYIENLPAPPILIGHSMGGLIVQLLMQRSLGLLGVAISSAPPKNLLSLRWSFFKSNWPMLNPLYGSGTPYLMPFSHFQYSFVHTLPEEEQRRAYDRHVAPESRRVGRSTLSSVARINYSAATRPLLFLSGAEDRIIPASLNAANVRKYRRSSAHIEHRVFPGRTHYIIGQEGWTEVADTALAWIDSQRSRGMLPARAA